MSDMVASMKVIPEYRLVGWTDHFGGVGEVLVIGFGDTLNSVTTLNGVAIEEDGA